jgi:threonine dehydrogenase-like Zn-dependent dehydrogenase
MPKRLAITGPYQVEILDYEDPPLGPNQVLVKTELASGKHGTTMGMLDNRTFEGQQFDQEMRLFVEDTNPDAQRQPTRDSPWNLGTTGVGIVTEVGDEVSQFKVGERVFGLMDVRETNIRPVEQLWELGEIDPYLALCVEPAYVAFHSVRESQMRYGDAVVVVGLGALGLLAVRMARESGAETLIAIDPLPHRRELAAAYGADYTLDPNQGDAALEVHKLTGGKGVDIAIELSGVYPALQTAIRCVRVGGLVCSTGFYQGESKGLWLGREWHHNRLTMIVPHGCGWGHPPRDYPLWDSQRAYDAIVSMMRKGRLSADGLINLTLKPQDANRIFDIIREQTNEVTKYAVDFTGAG